MKKDVVLVLLLSIQFACAVNWNEYKGTEAFQVRPR